MSLVEFQRALADLVASPSFCARAIESPGTVLISYDLTDQERARLSVMVRNPLMATNCMLYRANRMTPIFIFFPKTCHLLGPNLRGELDAFWFADRAVDLQYVQETARFANFIKKRVRPATPNDQYLEEIVDYENASMQLRFANPTSDSLIRVVRFSHHPMTLLSVLEKFEPIPNNIPQGEYYVSIQARNERLEVILLPAVPTAAVET